jgi:hypothetical protein
MEENNEVSNSESNTTETAQTHVPQQPQESIPPQITSKNWLLPLLISVVILALSATGYFAYQNYKLKTEIETLSTLPATSTATPTPILEKRISDREVSQYSKKIFRDVSINENLLKIEKNTPVAVSEGFTLVSSLLSQDGTKIAFSEISNCYTPDHVDCRYKSMYNPDLKCSDCDPVYRLSYQDLKTQAISLLYEYPRDGDSDPFSSGGKAIFLHFPYAWTLDGQSIISKDGIMISLDMGGKQPNYYLINTINNNIELLGDEAGIRFSSDFSKAIILGINQDLSGSMYGNLYSDKIILKNLLSGEVTTLIEGDFYYFLNDFTSDNKEFMYSQISKEQADSMDWHDLLMIKIEELEQLTITLH